MGLAGRTGKVGRALEPLLQQAEGIEYVGGFGRGTQVPGFVKEHRPAVLIDFTHPGAVFANAMAAARAGVAPVIGTTGLSAAEVDQLEAACRQAGVGGMVAPNFAVGAVLMMHLAELAAPFFEAAEVIEMHHAGKVDAPSGTALATARRLGARKGFSYNRPEKVTLEGARGGEEASVAVHSVRLPGLVADQEVIFGLPGQTLTVAHRTTSREAYAPGVLLAVRKVAAEKRFYRGLDDLLGLRRPD
ncbi:MAG TPA: 4-hydroxy-tetrahydrodipicolinate reductase [Candidatus Acidoferrales bacterium]|nr:4-hydroxy-tetrahydrodipicolinate reductase [Candidatus Acidoferrales bacterium]